VRLPICWIPVLAAAVSAPGQVPLHDRRNVEIVSPATHFQVREYPSLGEWRARRSALRQQILSAAGMFPMPDRNPLHPITVKRLAVGDVVIETILLETLPGYFLAGNLYRPAQASGRRPAVLSPHGHWRRGRLENISSYSVPALGLNLARQGYIVFAHDMVGYQDTRQTSHDFGGWREQLWAFNPLGLQLWNSIRALDYLESRSDVDPARLAVTGASGGATQTILLAAVDDRVRVDAPVNMVSASAQGADPCEEAPNLRLDSFNVEFAAMMAPRPMLLVSCSGDWTHNTPAEEFPAVQRIYALYGAASQVYNEHFKAQHNYNADSRQAVYRFFNRDLLGLGEFYGPEAPVPPVNDTDLKAQTLPETALSYDSLFRQWREASDRQNQQAADPEAVRERLRLVFGAEWPSHPMSASEGDRMVLSRPGRGDRVPILWFPGTGEPSVVIHPDGIDAARRSPAVGALLAARQPVMLADVFQTGSAKAHRDRSGPYFLSYNQTDDANRVQDILTVLAYVRSLTGQPIRLVGLDDAAIWCVFAAALAPIPLDLSGAPARPFTGADEEFRERFFVPGIERAGGWQAAWKLLGSEGIVRAPGHRAAPSM
jgi:dienelactone hydrolase